MCDLAAEMEVPLSAAMSRVTRKHLVLEAHVEIHLVTMAHAISSLVKATSKRYRNSVAARRPSPLHPRCHRRHAPPAMKPIAATGLRPLPSRQAPLARPSDQRFQIKINLIAAKKFNVENLTFYFPASTCRRCRK